MVIFQHCNIYEDNGVILKIFDQWYDAVCNQNDTVLA